MYIAQLILFSRRCRVRVSQYVGWSFFFSFPFSTLLFFSEATVSVSRFLKSSFATVSVTWCCYCYFLVAPLNFISGTPKFYDSPIPGCGYAGSQRVHLMNHIKTHTGERPHKCDHPGCSYAATQLAHLRNHMKTHTGEKPFRCLVQGCDYAAAQRVHLRNHMLTHGGEKPFKCPVKDCDYAAVQKAHLRKHLKLHEDQSH